MFAKLGLAKLDISADITINEAEFDGLSLNLAKGTPIALWGGLGGSYGISDNLDLNLSAYWTVGDMDLDPFWNDIDFDFSEFDLQISEYSIGLSYFF